MSRNVEVSVFLSSLLLARGNLSLGLKVEMETLLWFPVQS